MLVSFVGEILIWFVFFHSLTKFLLVFRRSWWVAKYREKRLERQLDRRRWDDRVLGVQICLRSAHRSTGVLGRTGDEPKRGQFIKTRKASKEACKSTVKECGRREYTEGKTIRHHYLYGYFCWLYLLIRGIFYSNNVPSETFLDLLGLLSSFNVGIHGLWIDCNYPSLPFLTLSYISNKSALVEK